MTVLGVQVDGSASTDCFVEGRIAAASSHYWARKSQPTCRRIPLKDHLLWLYTTVFTTLLWGASAWSLTSALVKRLDTFELSLLRRFLVMLERRSFIIKGGLP